MSNDTQKIKDKLKAKFTPKKAALVAPSKDTALRTLRDALTNDEKDTKIIGFMQNIAKLKHNGPWRDYLAFYSANQSGALNSFKDHHKIMADNLLRDVKKAYIDSMDL